jgi:hypothetical protein
VFALADLKSYLLRVPGKDEVPPMWSHLHHKAKLPSLNNQVRVNLFHNLKFGINNKEGQGGDLNHDEDQGTSQESISMVHSRHQAKASRLLHNSSKVRSRHSQEQDMKGANGIGTPKYLKYQHSLYGTDKAMDSCSTIRR